MTKLRQLRADYGYTLREVAEGTGLSVPAISCYERGTKAPGMDAIVALAAYYCLTADQLIRYFLKREM